MPYLRHLLTPRWYLRRACPPPVLAAIEAAVRRTERHHGGEIRFAIETCLHLGRLHRADAGRARARELFAGLGVWDTAENNGVLIYLLLAGREVHIVADRGFDGVVVADEWQAVCRHMQAAFRDGRFEAGAVAGIEAVAALIGRRFPPRPGDRNELPDAPVVVG